MTLFYSATTGGFYDDMVHGAARIPADALEVTPSRHAELLDAQGSEAPVQIIASDTGTPIMSRQRTLTESELRAKLHSLLAQERSRRIAQIASLEQQLIDQRLGGTEASTRFAEIDAVRAQGEAIAAAINSASGSDLATFDPTDTLHWEAT